MKNPFERFYTDEVTIISVSDGKQYSDRGKRVYTEIETIAADVQPYNTGVAAVNRLLDDERGLTQNKQIRIFCADTDNLKAGAYARADGKLYRVMDVKKWKSGAEAVLDLMEGE
ncbi:MAG: hypothetical protein LIO53_02165 [Oscillospiraceae bacterium]|nr:hypothetical protein [Oscillospiraceae bacterium]